MPSALVWLIYIWLAVSVCVYGYRLYRRFARRGSGEAGDPSTAAAEQGSADAEARVAARLADMAPGAPGTGPGDQSRAPADAGPPPPPVPRPEPGSAPGTVADALDGIRLPAGLVPRVDVEDTDPRRVTFATAETGPTQVSADLADELGRLGSRVEALPGSDGGHRLQARRDATVVTATIAADEALDGAVVVLAL